MHTYTRARTHTCTHAHIHNHPPSHPQSPIIDEKAIDWNLLFNKLVHFCVECRRSFEVGADIPTLPVITPLLCNLGISIPGSISNEDHSPHIRLLVRMPKSDFNGFVALPAAGSGILEEFSEVFGVALPRRTLEQLSRAAAVVAVHGKLHFEFVGPFAQVLFNDFACVCGGVCVCGVCRWNYSQEKTLHVPNLLE
jgi:hypothetical protein